MIQEVALRDNAEINSTNKVLFCFGFFVGWLLLFLLFGFGLVGFCEVFFFGVVVVYKSLKW